MDGITPPSAGPNVIGFSAAIAQGAYTEIVDIIAPSQAAFGDLVNVEVKVKNIGDFAFYVAVTGRYDETVLTFSPDYAAVDAGAIQSFTTSFTMPDKGARVHAWSFYWTGEEWYQDDYDYVDIALEAIPEVFAGTISRKELEYDEVRGVIPVSNVPQGQRGLVHIWGRNDMSTNQKMGVYWFVADPDGYVAEEYGPSWEAFSTGPGDEHEFIGGRFDLSKAGKYTMWVELLMNRDDPQVVDSYIGDLCTVAAAVPEPEFRGFAVSEYTKR